MLLSQDQEQAYTKIMAWFRGTRDKRFALAGFAGTGKSTLAKKIAESIPGKVAFVAYTGKAANVLRSKGCHPASTIHSAIYVYIEDPKTGKSTFVLNIEGSELLSCDLVIVDEYSMLGEEIIGDLERIAKRVLYLGDPFQLPPVNGTCVIEPDFFMENIHRQALDSGILRAATAVRQGELLRYETSPDFIYQPKSKVPAESYLHANQIIVGRNKTRVSFNNRFRHRLGFNSELPVTSDKIICTKNNHEAGLFNGMIGVAASDAIFMPHESDQALSINFEADEGSFPDTLCWLGDFQAMEDGTEPVQFPMGAAKKLERFDFAYAITCHKSQGSEFESLLIYNEPVGSSKTERARWLYTAITRASKHCILVNPYER